MQGHRDTEIRLQEYKNTGIQGYRDTGMQGHRDTEISLKEYKDTRIQEYRDQLKGMQGYRNHAYDDNLGDMRWGYNSVTVDNPY